MLDLIVYFVYHLIKISLKELAGQIVQVLISFYFLQMRKIMKKFAQRLKKLRNEKGLSILKLSRAIKISLSTICRWENCQTEVKGTQLVTLAKFFNVSIDYLMGLED